MERSPLTPTLSPMGRGGKAVHIFTTADGNDAFPVQKRPLLMGLIRPAPFPLFAHCVGMSDKPVATITTHTDKTGALVWYVGGQLAERPKESAPRDVYEAMQNAFGKYFPGLDLSGAEWAVFPIDRVEAKAENGKMPDGPVIRESGNALYCWPTKLAFAPLLADRVVEKLNCISRESGNLLFCKGQGPRLRGECKKEDTQNLLPYAQPPWNIVEWKKGR